MPKGAILTNRNISAACDLLATLGFGFGPGDINLHYLPFAHIYGKAVGMELAEYMAITSAFALPTDLQTAVPLYRPTVLFGVPRVWNRYRAEIERQAGERGFKAGLLRWGISRKEGTIGRWLSKKFILPSIRKKLGMDLTRVLVTGSAAIPPETTAFFLMLGLELREGYGATETTGGIFANSLTDYKFGSLGKPGIGVEARIEVREGIDTAPNTGTYSTCAATLIFAGYWNLPAKTAEVLDADGWYNTGDIVQIDTDGFAWFHAPHETAEEAGHRRILRRGDDRNRTHWSPNDHRGGSHW